jgi:hypothetical protein
MLPPKAQGSGIVAAWPSIPEGGDVRSGSKGDCAPQKVMSAKGQKQTCTFGQLEKQQGRQFEAA